MTGYRLASYAATTGARAGAVLDDTVYDVATLTAEPRYADVADVLEDWDKAHEAIESALVAPQVAGLSLVSTTLLAPVARPGAIYCIGSNYRDHAEEMRIAAGRPVVAGPRERGMEPFFFIKSSHAIAGPGATVPATRYTGQLDYELELVVVIGRTARDLTVDNALTCVAGYTVGNDVSARDLKAREQAPAASLFRADWLRHKSFDNSAPIGPWITPAAFIDDPADLGMRLWVNGKLKQDSNSSNMIFDVREQLAFLSSGITLHPGDLVMTGTPAGVGAGRNEYLQAGDVVSMQIDEIGDLQFHVG